MIGPHLQADGNAASFAAVTIVAACSTGTMGTLCSISLAAANIMIPPLAANGGPILQLQKQYYGDNLRWNLRSFLMPMHGICFGVPTEGC